MKEICHCIHFFFWCRTDESKPLDSTLCGRVEDVVRAVEAPEEKDARSDDIIVLQVWWAAGLLTRGPQNVLVWNWVSSILQGWSRNGSERPPQQEKKDGSDIYDKDSDSDAAPTASSLRY